MRIIGISGKMRSGKDTASSRIQVRYDATVRSYADPLKEAAAIMFGEPLETFYSHEGKLALNANWGMTNRDILQKFGTECARKVFYDDFWIRRFDLEVKKLAAEGATTIIIPDCRFQNEAEWIKSMGGTLIKIIRPSEEHHPKFFESIKAKVLSWFGVYEWWNHPSELGYPDHLNDYIIHNDGSFSEYTDIIDAICDSMDEASE